MIFGEINIVFNDISLIIQQSAKIQLKIRQ